MKNSILIVFSILIATITLAYSLYTVSWSDFPLSAEKIQKITGIPVSDELIKVYTCSSTAEFTEISGSPYWVLASYKEKRIYLQPASLIPNITRTISHELSHSYFKQFKFPYWIEEGLVCIITGEWRGKSLDKLDKIEQVEISDLDFYTYNNYSYTCWIEVSKIINENGFDFLLKKYGVK
ncbi:MAG: hypothetical protein PWQ77_2246 [Kosmotogales bacterium]|nr:hypothetical protein [Kosmotogales bacterium]